MAHLEIDTLIDELISLHEKLRSWQAVGDHFGVSKITAWRIVHDGYEPRDNAIRRKLGLPETITHSQHRDAQGRFMRKIGQ